MSQPARRFVAGTPRLHYLEWNPRGRHTVVFLHGNSANSWWWQSAAEALSAADLRLLALDFRGHGDSEWVRPPAYLPDDYADDLVRLIRFAKAEDATAAGHSMGGIVVLAFTQRYHQLLRAVIALDIAISSSPRRNRYLARLKSLPIISYPDLATAKARFRLMPDDGIIPAEVLADVAERSLHRTADDRYTLKFDRESFFGSDGLDVMTAIGSVRIPLLLVRAEHSRIMSAEAARAAARSNPLVRLLTIPGVGHHLPLECPAALARVIADFVKPPT
jgi:pimeloyl-ACP methyl ester carboxylesterase